MFNIPTCLSIAQSREIDRLALEFLQLSTLVLMENAGRGTADLIERLYTPRPVKVCCGKGNNGGDGFVIARQLAARGWETRVLLCAARNELRGDAARNADVFERGGGTIDELSPFSNDAQLVFSGDALLVDALLGTGAQGQVRPPLDKVVGAINRSGAPVIAIDLPSGLDADRGSAGTPTIRATHTATFVAPKRGFAQREARDYLGRVHVVNLGLPPALFERLSH